MEKNYNFIQVEKEMQDFWEKEQVYKFTKEGSSGIYSIDTPPPTVSGSLHIGHIFSYTQAEMIARFKRMQGFNVFYPFGFDDNGLPTERLVEKEKGIKAKDILRSDFVDICMEVSQKYEEDFKALWKSLGFSVDWSLEYRTISHDVQKISQQLFLDLVAMKKAYTKDSPVLWCSECATSIAQAELETKETDTEFIYIPFITGEEDLLVATTRPELLYGCVCLFVNPDDERYSKYVGKSAKVPLYNYYIPIMTDDKVSKEKGTGVVMCATFGDSTDLLWYEEHGLEYRKVILPNGYIENGVPFIGGLEVRRARKEIIRLLGENNLLIKSESISHTVAVHERCGHEIEIIPSKQWYIDVLSEKETFLKLADSINWYPAIMKRRYIDWVENLKWDWCISRQRYFGVPFPVWYCRDCGKAFFSEKLPANPIEEEYSGICECGCKEFIPERAVMDTWATSSVTPQINERTGLELVPMGMRTHAHEIIRTWTFYTIVRSFYHTGKIPWKDLMISGFVLAKKGEKISKSKSNNNNDPVSLISNHSADVLRYWAANAKLGTDTMFNIDELGSSKRFITKLWNASKFAISHLQDFKKGNNQTLLPIDRWIITCTDRTIKKATELLNSYEVGATRHEIDDLFWKDFCDNYVEIVKDRLYKPELHGEQERASGQYATYYALLNILKLYAIYVPHITEYIYQDFFRQYEEEVSIHLLKWNITADTDEDILSFGDEVKEILFNVRKYKSDNNLSMRAETGCLDIETDRSNYEYFKATEKDLIACTNAGKCNYILK